MHTLILEPRRDVTAGNLRSRGMQLTQTSEQKASKLNEHHATYNILAHLVHTGPPQCTKLELPYLARAGVIN